MLSGLDIHIAAPLSSMGTTEAQGSSSETCLYLHSSASLMTKDGQLDCPLGYYRLNVTHCQGKDYPAELDLGRGHEETSTTLRKEEHLSLPGGLHWATLSPSIGELSEMLAPGTKELGDLFESDGVKSPFLPIFPYPHSEHG